MGKRNRQHLETTYGPVDLDANLMPEFRSVVRGWNDIGVHADLDDVAWAFAEQQKLLGPAVDCNSQEFIEAWSTRVEELARRHD